MSNVLGRNKGTATSSSSQDLCGRESAFTAPTACPSFPSSPFPPTPIKGGLEQALDFCDCLSPPLRWVRIPLELLPPPARSPPRSSSTRQASARASGRSLESAENAPCPLPGPKKKKKYGFVGVTPEPDGGWDPARKRPGAAGGRHGREGCPEGGRTGGAGARNAGLSGDGGCGWEGVAEDSYDPRREDVVAGRGAVGEGNAGRRIREREMMDLWWLTGGCSEALPTTSVVDEQRTASLHPPDAPLPRLDRSSSGISGGFSPVVPTVCNAESTLARYGFHSLQ